MKNLKNINEYTYSAESNLLNEIHAATINEIENGNITEADFPALINKLNEVKHKIFRISGHENVIFTEVKTVFDNRKTIKINEEFEIVNPDFSKNFYYICGKIKINKMDNFEKFYIG